MVGEALISKKGKKTRRWKTRSKAKGLVPASKLVVKSQVVGKEQRKEIPKASKAEDPCHYYHEKGHSKSNYPKGIDVGPIRRGTEGTGWKGGGDMALRGWCGEGRGAQGMGNEGAVLDG
ncbi:UNVERIFIED_CONTAM: hypothetical protein Sindi_2343600 [Sesamum indicum]